MRLDASLMKALSSGTRRDILHALKDHHGIILSDLARALGKHVTTVKEHLQVLERVGLVEKDKQPGRKFVFYTLSNEGSRILLPFISDVSVVFLIGFLVMAGGIQNLIAPFSPAFEGVMPMDRAIEPTKVKTVQEAPREDRQVMTGGGGGATLGEDPPVERMPAPEMADVDMVEPQPTMMAVAAPRAAVASEGMAVEVDKSADVEEEGTSIQKAKKEQEVPADVTGSTARRSNILSQVLLAIGCVAMGYSLLLTRRRRIIFEKLEEMAEGDE